MKPTKNLSDLIALMAHLRVFCPWDKKQTPQSLLPYLLEESYEVIEATHLGDVLAIKEEWGDVLLQVVFAAQIYAEQGDFDLGDVIYALMDKLIRRHPHVFEGGEIANADEVKQQWDDIKTQERQFVPKALLDGIQGTALMQAQTLTKRVAKVGFDWDEVAGAVAKLDEEVAELKEQLIAPIPDQDKLSDELGDVLFSVVNVARKLDIDSEQALLGAVGKFKHRFAFIEQQLAKQGLTPQSATLEQMNGLWECAKQN